jgi:hypothetical protein
MPVLALKKMCSAWLFVLLPLCGCARQPGTTSGAEGSPSVTPDGSLTTAEYVHLGLPSLDREWSVEDLVEASAVLQGVSQKDSRQLPRYQSERSGEVFARLIGSPPPLLQDRSQPVSLRVPKGLEMYDATNRLFKMYVTAHLLQLTGGSEVVEVYGAVLRRTTLMIDLVSEFVRTLDKNDPKYPVRMEGLEKWRRALAEIIDGGLIMLTEKYKYRVSERVRLASHMRETFSSIVPELTPGIRTELLARLERMTADPELQDLQPGLNDLHGIVRKALAPRLPPD